MKISNNLSDETVLAEIGVRITQQRIRQGMTQAILAEQSGVGKRTVERIEAGKPAQISNLVRILRALDLLTALDSAIPEAQTGPMDLLKRKGKQRKRVYTQRVTEDTTRPWSWDDES